MDRLKVKSEKIIFLGRLQCDLDVLQSVISKAEDSCIFVCGDIGLSMDYNFSYGCMSALEHWENLLIERNNYLMILRGSIDNPVLFNGSRDKWNKGVPSNDIVRYTLVKDYTIVDVCNSSGASVNILCIGGAINTYCSTRVPYINYWPNEDIKYVDLVDVNDVEIICSYACFRGVYKMDTRNSIEHLQRVYPYFRDSLYAENTTLKEIYKRYRPKMWVFSNNAEAGVETFEETEFRAIAAGTGEGMTVDEIKERVAKSVATKKEIKEARDDVRNNTNTKTRKR
jgi:hypothetical protein